MKEKVKLVVVIPIGTLSAKNRYEHMVDTIASVEHYTRNDCRIVLQDNSSPLQLGKKLKGLFPNVDVVRAPINYRMFGGLYKSLSLALLHIHASYDFQVLLKMDTDALMTGYGLEDAAAEFFGRNPQVGEIGNHVFDGKGIEWPRRRLINETNMLGWLRDRQRCATLRYYLQLARTHGYQLGEHILGGAALYSPVFIERLVDRGFLLREELSRCVLHEDHLFGLLCKAVGLELAGRTVPEFPLAVVWRGLPSSPESLAENGASVVHSTRSWQGMNEDDIRAFFRARREAAPPTSAQSDQTQEYARSVRV